MGSGFRVLTYLHYPTCHCLISSFELIILPRKKRTIGISSKAQQGTSTLTPAQNGHLVIVMLMRMIIIITLMMMMMMTMMMMMMMMMALRAQRLVELFSCSDYLTA